MTGPGMPPSRQGLPPNLRFSTSSNSASEEDISQGTIPHTGFHQIAAVVLSYNIDPSTPG